jgi:hypothetical protein
LSKETKEIFGERCHWVHSQFQEPPKGGGGGKGEDYLKVSIIKPIEKIAENPNEGNTIIWIFSYFFNRFNYLQSFKTNTNTQSFGLDNFSFQIFFFLINVRHSFSKLKVILILIIKIAK